MGTQTLKSLVISVCVWGILEILETWQTLKKNPVIYIFKIPFKFLKLNLNFLLKQISNPCCIHHYKLSLMGWSLTHKVIWHDMSLHTELYHQIFPFQKLTGIDMTKKCFSHDTTIEWIQHVPRMPVVVSVSVLFFQSLKYKVQTHQHPSNGTEM
jgi:hypothetical protein